MFSEYQVLRIQVLRIISSLSSWETKYNSRILRLPQWKVGSTLCELTWPSIPSASQRRSAHGHHAHCQLDQCVMPGREPLPLRGSWICPLICLQMGPSQSGSCSEAEVGRLFCLRNALRVLYRAGKAAVITGGAPAKTKGRKKRVGLMRNMLKIVFST